MKMQDRQRILVALSLIFLWGLASWLIAKRYYQARVQTLVQQETRLSQARVDDLVDSIRRNLSYVSGIPEVLRESQRVKQAVTRFGEGTEAETNPAATPRMRAEAWKTDPQLKPLHEFLALAGTSLHADLIVLLDAKGNCIAASDILSENSPLGYNYAERQYFQAARKGQRGMQYAAGMATRLPGIYFASPVWVNKHFAGALVAKIDLPRLTYLVGQADVFVADREGVVVLAHDPSLQYKVVKGAAVFGLSPAERMDLYHKTDFAELPVRPWEEPGFPQFVQIGQNPNPHLLISQQLPEFGLTVYNGAEVGDLHALNRENAWFGVLLAVSGSVLILIGYGALLYVNSVRRARRTLWRQANFDRLTGLPNRSMFYDRLDQEIRNSNRSKLPMGLLLIDVDLFKEVNDTYGHAAGDILLQKVAHRIKTCVRDSDTVARLGGDEFTVILPNLSDKSHIEDIAQEIIGKLAAPFHLGKDVAHVSASIGITMFPHDARILGELVKNADQAMYAAKREGRNRFSYFNLKLQENAERRLRMVNDLRHALRSGQFSLHFQPIVDLATGKVVKAEALMRWHHPERGWVGPGEFIPVAEETGLIHEMGDWVFKQAVHWAKYWTSRFSPDFQVSINMSPVQFRPEGRSFVSEWMRYLKEEGLSGRNMAIEITEGVLLNAQSDVSDRLLEFHDAGVDLEVDDFGTGYSSLSYLKKFDIDYLKIDRSFVTHLETDGEDRILTEAIIMMAHKLGMKVVVEGIETEGQRDQLRAAGCDYGQGYLFSRPVPPELIESKLL
jgi:diguanylate cyclase (GGDEF)-like protein